MVLGDCDSNPTQYDPKYLYILQMWHGNGQNCFDKGSPLPNANLFYYYEISEANSKYIVLINWLRENCEMHLTFNNRLPQRYSGIFEYHFSNTFFGCWNVLISKIVFN